MVPVAWRSDVRTSRRHASTGVYGRTATRTRPAWARGKGSRSTVLANEPSSESARSGPGIHLPAPIRPRDEPPVVPHPATNSRHNAAARRALFFMVRPRRATMGVSARDPTSPSSTAVEAAPWVETRSRRAVSSLWLLGATSWAASTTSAASRTRARRHCNPPWPGKGRPRAGVAASVWPGRSVDLPSSNRPGPGRLPRSGHRADVSGSSSIDPQIAIGSS